MISQQNQHQITHPIYIITDNDKKEITPQRLKKPLGVGATGAVYALNKEKLVLKIYLDKVLNKYSRDYADKLQAMLNNQPKNTEIEIDGKKYNQFAWPLYLVQNQQNQIIGYAMTQLAKKDYIDFKTYLYPDIDDGVEEILDLSITDRIQVACNLAIAVHNLHNAGHLFVDMKQDNIFIHKINHTICFIDCDGFSINQGEYPPRHFTDNYRAPFVLQNNLKPQDLSNDKYQDYYCLAHLIFEILNYNISPFKGIPQKELQQELTNNGNTYEYKVKKQLYPYAIDMKHSHIIQPDKYSIHEYLPQDIRQLFELAFTKNKQNIPTAQQWIQCLKSHIDNNNFEKCSTHPENRLHHHFKQTNCFACEVFSGSINKKTEKQQASVDLLPSKSKNDTTANKTHATNKKTIQTEIKEEIHQIEENNQNKNETPTQNVSVKENNEKKEDKETNGRLARLEYFGASIFTLCSQAVYYYFAAHDFMGALMSAVIFLGIPLSLFGGVAALLGVIIFLSPVVIPIYISLRLHDINKTGRSILITALPLMALSAAIAFNTDLIRIFRLHNNDDVSLSLFCFLLSVSYFVLFLPVCCFESYPYDNKYGKGLLGKYKKTT